VLLQRGAAPVVGLDFSAPMLKQAAAFAPNLVLADLLALSLRASRFDVAVCGLAVGHVEDLARAMREIGRVLTPGGTLIYSDFHPVGHWLGWRRTFRAADGREYEVPHHTHLYADHVAACSSAGLKIEEAREPRIDFAHKWQGCPALLVIRARKEA
jgi:malonyl-CoA O-methyltransferase